MKAIIIKPLGEFSIIGDNLIKAKTPAVTIVAAWINAETGVGPAIASGNQVCKPNWADLPAAPINKKIPIVLIVLNSNVPNTIVSFNK